MVDDRTAGYRGPQVCTIVGITYRQLDYWARTNLLQPSISEARGSGTQRRYSYGDLLQLKVIKRLIDAGISLQQSRAAIDCLRSSGENVATANLVIEQKRAMLRSGEEITDLLRGGQGMLNILPMAGVVSEVDAAILQLSKSKAAGGADGADGSEIGRPGRSSATGG